VRRRGGRIRGSSAFDNVGSKARASTCFPNKIERQRFLLLPSGQSLCSLLGDRRKLYDAKVFISELILRGVAPVSMQSHTAHHSTAHSLPDHTVYCWHASQTMHATYAPFDSVSVTLDLNAVSLTETLTGAGDVHLHHTLLALKRGRVRVFTRSV